MVGGGGPMAPLAPPGSYIYAFITYAQTSQYAFAWAWLEHGPDEVCHLFRLSVQKLTVTMHVDVSDSILFSKKESNFRSSITLYFNKSVMVGDNTINGCLRWPACVVLSCCIPVKQYTQICLRVNSFEPHSQVIHS